MHGGKTNKRSLYKFNHDPNVFRRISLPLAGYVRKKQYQAFINIFDIKSEDKILDVGTAPDTTLRYTNFFEKVYPFKKNLYIASVEDCSLLVKQYCLADFILLKPNEKFPLKDKSFDYVVSWAVLEHVGSRKNQKFFIKELMRIGKHVFIATPDRWAVYEPHTVLFFLHWLPSEIFRKILLLLGKKFWAKEENLNIISIKEAEHLVKNTGLKVRRFKIFNILPSHIFIYGTSE